MVDLWERPRWQPTDEAVRSRSWLAREQTLFALLMGIRESSIAEVYVRGRRLDPA